METISLNINGVCRELAVGKNWTLLKTLRDGLRLTGTKCGCETGDCGACMVIIDGVATRSCLVKAVNLEGKAIDPNLCRCTGYDNIVKAILLAASRMGGNRNGQ